MASTIDNCYWMLLLTIAILKIIKIAMVLSLISYNFNNYKWQVEDITCRIIWEIVELDRISNWVDNGLKYYD